MINGMRVKSSVRKWSRSSLFKVSNGRRFFSENRGIGGINRMVSIQIVPNLDVESPDEVATSLADLQGQATKERVPWFQSVMPPSYFRQVPKERRMRHLTSVAAVPDLEDIPEMVSKNYNSENELTGVSVISNGQRDAAKFHNVLSKIPSTSDIQAVNLYTSSDGLLAITDITLNEQVSPAPQLPKELKKYVTELQEGKFETDRTQYLNNTGEKLHAIPGSNFEQENFMDFIHNIQSPGFWNVSPRRFCKFVDMYHELLKKGTDEVLIDVESNYGGVRGKTMYTLAVSNVLIKPTLARIVAYFLSNGVSIDRCHVEKVKQNRVIEDSEQIDYNDVTFLRFVVDHVDPEDSFLEEVQASLPLVAKWYDNSVVNTLATVKARHPFAAEKNLRLVDMEVLTGLMNCVHLVCSGTEMYEFSKPNIYQVMHRPQTYSIVDVFKKRFDPHHKHPEQDDASFLQRLAEIKESYDTYIEIEVERKVLDKMVDIVKGTLRTNLYNPDRFAFSLKLKPEVCVDPNDELRQTLPYGVFFVNGRRFRGLQLRFREIARGGLRLVTPLNPQAFTIESTRQYGECYDLAFAQQQKNKDIAEGGSKAVCLINSHEDEIDRKHLLRKSVKAFVNSLLDLITVHNTNKEEELIFLGPDEQIGIEHINWIVRRAGERGYRMPTAFMSSKPDQGINHKEFGVTSEGVAVFLDTALKALNILDKDTFTVKITGGPDGDVAGNMLKILYREYGEKCRIVGIADGTGCVEDQENGIAWGELLRLVEESKPLDEIDRSKLSSTTMVYDLEKAEGVRMRNTMHNRIISDAFVPGGGRPQTINKTNWEQFLCEVDGKKVPSSKLIAEGANLFLTNEARAELGKLGCVVVKDSSANKCGVICSAFEIISCMLLDKPEFLRIKGELVPQVVEKLQHIARREAELLMTEYRKNISEDGKVAADFNLVNTSIEISHAINRATDGIREKLKELVKEDKQVLEQYRPLVKAFLPEALVTAGYQNFDAKVPEIYVINLVSTILACELVYNEGIDFVKAIKDDNVLTDTAFKYIAEKGLVSKFVAAIENSNLSKDEVNVVSKLLQLGGPRAALLAGGIDKL